MKTLFTMLLAAILTAGFAQNKTTMAFSAEIANRNSDTLSIIDNQILIKRMIVDKNGIFKGKFAVKSGMYLLSNGTEVTEVYLKNGYDLQLRMDAKMFDETLVYSGKGAAENNYLARKFVMQEAANYDAFLAANETTFKAMLEQKSTADLALLDKSGLDANLVRLEKLGVGHDIDGIQEYYKNTQVNRKLNGTIAPAFDYINAAGGRTTLADLKGKYVYIDLWATWCGPCRAEIPFLQDIEKKYEGRNITFMSLSIDVPKDAGKWKDMVEKLKLKGVQLMAENAWESAIINAYKVTGIPRFILIDPKGVIVDSDAPRPSDAKLGSELDRVLGVN